MINGFISGVAKTVMPRVTYVHSKVVRVRLILNKSVIRSRWVGEQL